MRLKQTIGDKAFSIFIYSISFAILIATLYPLYFVIIASFSNPVEVTSGHVWLFPKDITFLGYQRIFHDDRIWTGYVNSILYTIAGTAVSMAVTLPAAYALSRRDFRPRKALMLYFVFTMFFSGGLIPTYITINTYGLTDTVWVMILPFAFNTFNMIIARTFFENSIPDELLEAARIDGCGNTRFFFQIVIPLSKAVLSVILLFFIVTKWNEYFMALIYLQKQELMPLQIILRNILLQNSAFQNGSGATGNSSVANLADLIKYGVIIVSTLPMLLIYPFIQKYFEPDSKRISMFPEGKIYSLPAVRPFRPDSFNVMMINKKWLDKLQLKEPTTLDELRDVLIAFRDKDPNGNGKKDEIGMDWWAGVGGSQGSRGLFSVTSLLGSYGVSDHHTEEMIGVKDGKIRFLFAGDEYKKLVEYLSGLWKDNLINKEVFTQDYSGMKAKAQQDDVSTVGVTFGWSLSDRVGKWASEYEPLAPLMSSNDIKPVWPTSPARVKMGTNLFAMTKKNKHPVETIKWIDQFYSEENSVQGYYGSIPEFITKNDDGSYTIIPAANGDQDTQQWTNSLVDNNPLYSSKALEAKTTVPPSVTARLDQDKIYKDYQPENMKDIYPIVKFTADQIDEMSLNKTDIFKLVDQKFAEWIYKANIDSQWDDYLKQLDQMGLPMVEKIYQKGYDDYYKE